MVPKGSNGHFLGGLGFKVKGGIEFWWVLNCKEPWLVPGTHYICLRSSNGVHYRGICIIFLVRRPSVSQLDFSMVHMSDDWYPGVGGHQDESRARDTEP